MKRNPLFFVCLSILILISWNNAQAIKLYDDFSSGILDGNKWEYPPASRYIADGKLQISLSSGAGRARLRTLLKNPETVTALSCDMSVDNTSIDTGNNTTVRSYLGGFFYNADESGTSARGDVWADIYIEEKEGGLMQIGYGIWQADDASLEHFTVITEDIIIQPGILRKGTTYTLSISWDGSSGFTFQVTGPSSSESGSVVFTGPDYGRSAVSDRMTGHHLAIDSFSSTGQGSITASIDNVYVNGSQAVYDDFSGSDIDPNKWDANQFLRSVQDGAVVLKTGGANSTSGEKSYYSRLRLIPDDADYVEARVKIKSGSQVQLNGADDAIAAVRIGGYYYNDTTGGNYNGEEGNVFVAVRLKLWPDGTLHADTRGWRMNNADASQYTSIEAMRHNFTKTYAFDTEYVCAIKFDGRTFTFTVDGEVWQYTVQGNVFSPIYENRRIETQVWTMPGASGQIEATVDDVRVDDDTADSINRSPSVPVLSSPADGSAGVPLTPNLAVSGFSDPDPDDVHSATLWQVSTDSGFSTHVIYAKSATRLTAVHIPDLILEENTTYYWRTKVYDDQDNSSGWSEPFSFTTLDTGTDLNGNGIPDSLENSTADLDNDGTADSQQADIKTLNTVVGNGQMGISIQGATTVTSLGRISSIDPQAVSQSARPQEMDLGLFGLRIGVADPGDIATVTIYFSKPADDNAVWYMYDRINDWVDYSEYATFSADRMSVTVRLKDGAYGDADGIENGIIVDPSGFGVASWIKGLVTDAATSEVITTATVLIKDLDLSLNSRLNGNYISMILPGTYDVAVSAPGYRPQTLSGVVVAENDTVSKDVALQADEASLRAVIKTVEAGDVEAVWKEGGKAATSRGDRVVWGHFYASPDDVSWGSQNNPEVYVKAWYDVSGRVDVNFFHVSVPDIDVYAQYNGVELTGTATTEKRYIRHYYNDNQTDGTSENDEDGVPADGYTPSHNPTAYVTVNSLNIGATINTVEAAGSIDGVWKLGGQDLTARGDQVVWGYFYADPGQVSWGSKNNPELFVKIWFDAGGRIDVNYFHVSVPDIEVYSDYAADGVYDTKGTAIMDDRYIRHEYTKK